MRLMLRKTWLFLLMFCLLITTISAQESNYAIYEVGANSTMLGGAVTAGVKDNSAIYYNPGALVFVEKSNLSIETASFFGGFLKIKNGAGTNVDIKSNSVDVIPSIIAGTIKSKNLEDWTFSYAVMTTYSSFIQFNNRVAKFYDVIQSQPGDEYYVGVYDYSNKMRDVRIGAAASKKISDNLGIGASLFGVYRNQDFLLSKEGNVSRSENDSLFTIGFSRIARGMVFSSLSMVLQFGAVYKVNNSKFGLNIALPNLNLDIIAKGKISESLNTFVPSAGVPLFSSSRFGEKLKTTHKIPLTIAAGYQRMYAEIDWNFKVTYSAPIATYTQIATEPNQDPANSDPLIVESEARPILNVAVGLRKDIRDGLSFLGGFRTDLNYDPDVDPGGLEFVDRMSYWNLYHFTGGVIWYNQKAHLTLGADYAMGISKGDLQQVNLTEPSDNNLLFGVRNSDTNTFYGQLNIVLGFAITFGNGE